MILSVVVSKQKNKFNGEMRASELSPHFLYIGN